MATADSWPIFLYEDFTCDVDDLENGLFPEQPLGEGKVTPTLPSRFAIIIFATGL
jgi:hypothetical protein